MEMSETGKNLRLRKGSPFKGDDRNELGLQVSGVYLADLISNKLFCITNLLRALHVDSLT